VKPIVPIAANGRDASAAITPLVRGNVPLHRQLKRLLHDAIHGGRLRSGDTLPTERELAIRHGVSRITVRHALRDLESEGLVRRSRPKGNVVAGGTAPAGNAWSFDSLQDILTFGEQTRVRIFSFSPKPAPEDVAAIFGLDSGVLLPCVHGMRMLKSEPLSEFTFWITPTVASQLTREDVSQSILFSVLETRLGIRFIRAEQTVWSELAGARLAKLLRTGPKAPILAIRRVYVAEQGVPVEVAVSRFHGLRYRMHHVLSRLPAARTAVP
jgi:GntR family transcriptional regulator